MFSLLSPIPALSSYPGPYKVGSKDYEIPVEEIGSKAATPDSSITTVKFRLYYPTTSSATSKHPIYWLPHPQTHWNEAYHSFLGVSERLARLLNYLPALWSYTTIPATHAAPLLKPSGQPIPLAIFSHGLGGNYNSYSSICGALASCGVVVAAPEHRDGSAPTSIIRSPNGSIAKTVPYHRIEHSPSTETFNARNAQLRIRLWELELLYTVLNGMDAGKVYSNFTVEPKPDPRTDLIFENGFDLTPGRVSFIGHSFGAATTVQFVKSVYYHQYAPPLPAELENDPDHQHLFTPAENHELVQQITPSTPIALLDVWTMPLQSQTTGWLWQRPLPCYDKGESDTQKPNTVAIISTEFVNWTELFNRTKALLSENPAAVLKALDQSGELHAPSNTDPTAPQASPLLPADVRKASTKADDHEVDAIESKSASYRSVNGDSQDEDLLPSAASSPLIFPSQPNTPAVEREFDLNFDFHLDEAKELESEIEVATVATTLLNTAGKVDMTDSADTTPGTSTFTSRAASPTPEDASPLSSIESLPSTSSLQSLNNSASKAPVLSSMPPNDLTDSPSIPSKSTPRLFTIPNSAHLSQSDFGVLFPFLTRYLMKAQDPEETILLNVRAILAVMRGQGLPVAKIGNMRDSKNNDENGEGDVEDMILEEDCGVKRWENIAYS